MRWLSKLNNTCHSPRSAQLYNAYASLQLFAWAEIVGCVPAPTISEYLQNIADYINQSSFFTLHKIEQL
jgi:hypothetical protein